MRLRRRGVRSRLLLAVVLSTSVALATGVAVSNLILQQRVRTSATAAARAQAYAKASTLRVQDGELIVPPHDDDVLGGRVWVFANGRVLAQPQVSGKLDRAAAALALGPERSRQISSHTRLYALPVVRSGKRVGTVVAGVSLSAYGQTASAALVGSLVLAVLLLAAVTVMTRAILERALLPVSRMTADAAAWSEHDVDRRFDRGEPYDELTLLAATLDGLLDRLAASLRYEQRFAAELSHELRTPLARIAAQTDLALSRQRTSDEYHASLVAVRASADQMARTVTALVGAARQEAGLTRATSNARDAIATALASVRPLADEHGVEVGSPRPGEPLRVGANGELVAQILMPLLENAVFHAERRADIDVERRGASALIAVTDDGPGINPAEAMRIFDPGVRGRATARQSDTGGAGLGLPLARRLARSAGGDVDADPSAPGGRFVVRLPLA